MKFKPGNIVHYHPIIGEEEHDGKQYLVTTAQFNKHLENRGTHTSGWVYWLAGKAGYVLEESLRMAATTTLDDIAVRVEMEDGSRWDVPSGVIAVSHARHYKDEHDGDVLRSYLEGTVPLFTECKAEIFDWACNDMDWSDVDSYAREVSPKLPVDYQEGWVNGYKEIVKWNNQ